MKVWEIQDMLGMSQGVLSIVQYITTVIWMRYWEKDGITGD